MKIMLNINKADHHYCISIGLPFMPQRCIPVLSFFEVLEVFVVYKIFVRWQTSHHDYDQAPFCRFRFFVFYHPGHLARRIAERAGASSRLSPLAG
jgi:hypothetical protein